MGTPQSISSSRGHDTDNRARDRHPRPAHAEILARKGAGPSRSPSPIYLPLVIARSGRDPSDGRFDGNTFHHPYGRRLHERRPFAPAGRGGDPGAGGASPHTDFTVIPGNGELRRPGRAARSSSSRSRREARRLLQLGRGGDRDPDQVRPRLHEVAGGDRLRGGLPRADAACVSLTSKTHLYKAGLGPQGPRPTALLPFDDLEALEYAFKTRVAAEDVAAIVIEPVQGEAGFVVLSTEFVRGLRRICDEHGIVLVADECRPASAGRADLRDEHFGIEPDLVAVAKSTWPACRSRACSDGRRSWTRPATAPSAAPTSATSVAIAAAHAVLDVPTIAAQRARRGDRRDDPRPDGELARPLRRGRRSARARGDAGRGLGLRDGKPAAELATAVAEGAARRASCSSRRGSTGTASACCCLQIEDAELAEALDVWEEVLTEVLG